MSKAPVPDDSRSRPVKHPWTNGQVERMNRTIKEATVTRYHHHSHAQPTAHLRAFIDACIYGRRLKAPRASHPANTFCKHGQASQIASHQSRTSYRV